jgi:hypothetical protein
MMHHAMHAASDGNDAAPVRGRFRGIECATKNGIRTVRADEDVTLNASPIGQVERDSIAVLCETGRLGAECNRLHADRIEQRAMQRRPQRDDRWSTQHRLGTG